MAVKTAITLLFTLITVKSLVRTTAKVIEHLEETSFTQRILHPVVTAESETDSQPFEPHSVQTNLPPRTVISTECRCGIHENMFRIRTNDSSIQIGNDTKIAAAAATEEEEMISSTVANVNGREEIEAFDDRAVETQTKTYQEWDENVASGPAIITAANQFPWIVALVYRNENGTGEHFCGGVLISSKFVLTVTHCLLGKVAEKTEVWLNERDLLLTTETPYPTLKIKAAKLIPHPNYNLLMYYNDISLIELSEAVDVRKGHLRPICLPPHENYDPIPAEGTKNGITAGWGRISFEGPKSDKLLHVEVPLISNKQCREESVAWYMDRVTDHMICAGDLKQGGPDSCPGDSGGPLFVETENSQYLLIGLVSWGDRCALARKPGVYTNVAKYLKWIDSIDKKNAEGTNFRCGT